jgi:HAD superfamily hydrolase (TIGR01509 family)
LTVRAAGVIFDFDGTVLDTESGEFEEWRATFRERGLELTLDVYQHSVGTVGGFDPCAYLAERTGEEFDQEALRQQVWARNKVRCESEAILPGVVDRLREAREGGMRTGVASSSPSSWVEGWLGRHGIRDLFDTVCTSDHVARVKPAPDLYLLAARRIGAVPAACVAFEDSPNGIRAARAAGMRCVAIPNALTRHLPLGEADLVLPSLADHPLEEILGRLGVGLPRAAPAPRR